MSSCISPVDISDIQSLSSNTLSPKNRENQDTLSCIICLETCKFPTTYKCGHHIACHDCVHKHIDSKKQIQDDINSDYIYNISCPVCKYEFITDENMTGFSFIPEKIVNILYKDIKNLSYNSMKICPYCNMEKSSLRHVTNCKNRVFHCHRCEFPIENYESHKTHRYLFCCILSEYLSISFKKHL